MFNFMDYLPQREVEEMKKNKKLPSAVKIDTIKIPSVNSLSNQIRKLDSFLLSKIQLEQTKNANSLKS